MEAFPIPPPAFDGRSRKIRFESIIEWIQLGWGFFRDHPGFWLLATFLYLAGTIILCMIPLIGSLIAMFLTPLFIVGLLHACKKMANDEAPVITDILAGFRKHTGSLIALGLINLSALTLIALIIGFITGKMLNNSFSTDSSSGVILTILALMFIVPIAMAVLFSPIFMAIWFAPALIYFNGVAPLSAMKMSFAACLKNFLPFLFYALIFLLLLFLATLTAGIGLLVLVPVISGSIYASYHDIFLAN